jgi:hypothetical protein
MAEANARDRICLSPSATRSQASPTDTRGREVRLKLGRNLLVEAGVIRMTPTSTVPLMVMHPL